MFSAFSCNLQSKTEKLAVMKTVNSFNIIFFEFFGYSNCFFNNDLNLNVRYRSAKSQQDLSKSSHGLFALLWSVKCLQNHCIKDPY